ncbi:MAG: putative toxin-antitoxin system toxin component, PIN family [Chloroflexota bacterium]
MIVAVLDTNTIVSAILGPRGIPNRILEAARSQQFTLATSSVIIAEVMTTLGRDRIRHKYRIDSTDMDRLRDLLEHETPCTLITHEVHGVATHPEDDLILATALSAGADYLVTGDAKLQRLGRYKGVAMVSPREFLDILQSRPAE